MIRRVPQLPPFLSASRPRSRCLPGYFVLALLAAAVLGGAPLGASPLAHRPCDYVLQGHVITLDSATPTADWVAVRDGLIVAVGNDGQDGAPANSPCAAGTPTVDLGGQTIVPGFIDSHSHLLAYGMASRWLDVSSTNPYFVPKEDYKPVVSLPQLQDRLREGLKNNSTGPVLGVAFDPSRSLEGRNPSIQDLDDVSNSVRILLWQASMHGMNANTPMLDCIWERLRCQAKNPCTGPAPGLGVNGASSSCPGVPPQYVASFFNGVIEETMLESSLMPIVACAASPADFSCPADGAPGATTPAPASARKADDGETKAAAFLARALADGAEIYAARGFTVGSDIVPDPMLQVYSTAGPLAPVDLVVQATSLVGRQKLTNLLRGLRTVYAGPIKVVADGSVQGRTAFLSQPYLGDPFSRGSMTQPNWVLAQFIEDAFQAGFPVAIHTNGDAATAISLDLIEATFRRYPEARGLRNVLIHAPMLDRDLARRMAALNLIPSFLIQHPWLWGQPICLTLLGPSRTNERYYPTRLAAETLPHFTLHSDAWVSPPDPLRMIWAARTRKVQDVKKLQGLDSGFTAACPAVLAPEQRISIERALRALTVDSAYQFGLEGEKGTITPGKHADFTVLSKDPRSMEADPDELLDIKVIGTVHRGACHWNGDAKNPCPK